MVIITSGKKIVNNMILKYSIFENYKNNNIKELNDIIIKEILPSLSKKVIYKFENNKISVNDPIYQFKFDIYLSQDGDKLVFEVKVNNSPSYEFDFPIDDASNINRIIGLLNKELNEIEISSETDEEGFEDVKIQDKKTKNSINKFSIDVKIIKEILDEAYILDELKYININTNELIRRMLKESRK